MVREGTRFNAEAEEHILKFDEVDAKREMSRLLAMMKTEGHWNYFVTLTCNESKIFRVATLHAAIEHSAIQQRKEASLLMHNHCVLLTRAWERTVHYTRKYLTTSSEQPLGRVKISWMRFEFQSAGALGNRPPVHGGLTLYSEPISQTLNRVKCSNAAMWSTDSLTDYNRLAQDGIVENYRQYSDLIDLCTSLPHHDCGQADFRCMKPK